MKNILRITAGALVLASAGSFVGLSQEATGFSTIGGSLSLSQRDFRIFDNFSASRLHNNNASDPNWPGYNQVELAAWKGGAEWGALAFGDGSGDPTQGVVGSGGANFDFFWSGEVLAAGGVDSNIISQIPGNSGGVLAFMQGPISNGWTIKFYEGWNWFDGPGSESGIDFQGVACHELGHALGLGHTGTGGATMTPSISGNGTNARSIATDDQNGVQFIYGSAAAGKPTISSVSGNTQPGGTVVITGTGFSTNNNEIWFNDDLNTGPPLKLLGVSSTGGGTQLSFSMPFGAESGGVHVKDDNSGDEALSEGHPFVAIAGPPVVDLFDLVGPSTGFVGNQLTYDIENATANDPYWLYASRNLNGSTINGQSFDIGNIIKTLDTGTTSGSGTASYTSGPVPGNLAGKTFHLEARVDDGGNTTDSNAITLSLF